MWGAYQGLLEEKALPGRQGIEGYRGGWVLNQETKEGEVEFLIINFFDSLDAVKKFAGQDYEAPVFEPKAKELLARVELIARHYEVKVSASGVPML